MSASKIQSDIVSKVIVLAGLFGYSSVTPAADQELPALEFLEYLGSWDGSDEDWILFTENEVEQNGSDDDGREPAPQGDKVAELEDEN